MGSEEKQNDSPEAIDPGGGVDSNTAQDESATIPCQSDAAVNAGATSSEQDEEAQNIRETQIKRLLASAEGEFYEQQEDENDVAPIAPTTRHDDHLHHNQPSSSGNSERILQFWSSDSNNSKNNQYDSATKMHSKTVLRLTGDGSSSKQSKLEMSDGSSTFIEAFGSSQAPSVPVPPQPPLTRQSPQPPQPGAFAAAPGGQGRRVSKVRFSLFRARTDEAIAAVQDVPPLSVTRDEEHGIIISNDESHRPSGGETPTRNMLSQAGSVQVNSSGFGLAVANQVSSEILFSDMPQAVEYEDKNSMENATVRWKTAPFLLLGFVIIAALVVTAIFLSLNHAKKEDNDNVALDEVATVNMAPIAMSMPDKLRSLLPEFTVNALRLERSPQYAAYEWMLRDPSLENYSEDRLIQRFALACLFLSTGGEQWYNSTHWMSYELHECHWLTRPVHEFDGNSDEDIKYPIPPSRPCRNMSNLESEGVYEHLWLEKNNLAGKLPPEVYLLTSLKSISLGQNALEGSLSSHLGNLRNLEAFAMPNNQITATIPTEIALCSHLIWISLYSNQISGTVPRAIFENLEDLEYLYYDYNQITGTLPSNLKKLSKLKVLYIEENNMTGPISTDLSALTGLEYLVLGGNEFSGSLPTELGTLSTLVQLVLRWNFLTGTIPSELGSLTSLEDLSIEENQLTGRVPSSLSQLSLLYVLQIEGNQVTGSIPSELGLIPFVGNPGNSSYSALGRELGVLGGLVGLHRNMLSGTMPSELGRWNVQRFWVHKNSLTGRLPSEIGQMSKAYFLSLNANQFTGNIVSEIGTLSQLQELELHFNQLTGSLPSELGLLSQLVYIDVANNSLTGTVPHELGMLADNGNHSVLEHFDISANLFVGTLPNEICQVDLRFDCTENLCGCSCLCDVVNGTTISTMYSVSPNDKNSSFQTRQ